MKAGLYHDMECKSERPQSQWQQRESLSDCPQPHANTRLSQNMLLQQKSAQQSTALRKATMAQADTVKGEGKDRCSKEARKGLDKGGGGSGARA